MKNLAGEKRIAYVALLSGVMTPRNQLMIETLKSIGFSVRILALRRIETKQLVPRGLESSISGWEWVGERRNESALKLMVSMPRMYSLFKKKLRTGTRKDLLLISHYFLLPLSKTFKGESIYDVSELWGRDLTKYIPFLPKSIAEKIIQFLEKRQLKRVGGVTVVDSRAGYLHRHYGKVLENVEALYNVPSCKYNIKRVVKRKEGPIGIVYVGGLDERRGVSEMIELISLFGKSRISVDWLFVGDERGNSKRIKDVAREYDSVSITIVDRMPYGDMVERISKYSYGIAAYQEGHSPYLMLGRHNARKIFSYMQSGLVVIAPNFGQIGKIVEEKTCGVLVDTRNPAEMYRAILNYEKNPDLYQNHKINGMAAIYRGLNWEIEEERFIKVVCKAIL